jgi:hypothetical protein
MSDTIGDILTIRFGGNWALDRDKFARIDRFIARRDVPMADKIKASRYADEIGMGAPTGTDDEYREAIEQEFGRC